MSKIIEKKESCKAWQKWKESFCKIKGEREKIMWRTNENNWFMWENMKYN